MPRYRYRSRHGWLAALLALLIVMAQQLGWLKPVTELAEREQPGLYSVHHFVDGDTIAVNMSGRIETVRFIGVDTPETHKPDTPVQCYGPAAAAYTRDVAGKQSVRLVSDPETTDRDRYGRLLRYVYLADGRLLNEQLIQNGYAFYYPYFPFAKADQFRADQQAAMAARKGLWSHCRPTPAGDGGYKMEQSQAEAGP